MSILYDGSKNSTLGSYRSMASYSQLDELEAEKAYSNRRNEIKKKLKRSGSIINFESQKGASKIALTSSIIQSTQNLLGQNLNTKRFTVSRSQIADCAIVPSLKVRLEMNRLALDKKANEPKISIGEITYNRNIQ